MEDINNLLNNNTPELINRLQLSYKWNNVEIEKDRTISKTTDNSLQQKILYLYNKAQALNNVPNPQDKSISINNTNICPLQEVFNIQLLYNIN